MRFKTVLIALTISLLATACIKEGDFSELRHPVIIEGEFDPVLGLPLVKMNANIEQLIGVLENNHLLDSTSNVSIYLDENDYVSFRYLDTFHTTFSYSGIKGSGPVLPPKFDFDTIRDEEILSGSVAVTLFEKMQQLNNENLQPRGMYFSLNALIKAFVSDSVQAFLDRGIRLYFDSLELHIECEDGNSHIPLINLNNNLDAQQLVQGQMVAVLDNYDMSQLINRKPSRINYTARMNIAIPIEQWEVLTDPDAFLDSIGVDSLTADMTAAADFPLQLYCHEIEYKNNAQIDLTMPALDSLISKVEEYVTLDSGTCLIIEAKNSLPLSFNMNIRPLDEDQIPLTNPIFTTDSVIYGAPLSKIFGHTAYASNGYTKSRVVVPLTLDMLRDISKTRYLQFSLSVSTSTRGAVEPKPTVVVRGEDKLDLTAYVVLAPHARLATPPIHIPLLSK